MLDGCHLRLLPQQLVLAYEYIPRDIIALVLMSIAHFAHLYMYGATLYALR